jgi:hypothetical protein
VKSDEEISTADSAQIESLIEHVKQGKLEQNDAQLMERLLRAFLTLITLLQRKNTTIKRLKQLFLGPQDKKGKGQSDATTRTTTTDQEKTSESGSSDEAASSSWCHSGATAAHLISSLYICARPEAFPHECGQIGHRGDTITEQAG